MAIALGRRVLRRVGRMYNARIGFYSGTMLAFGLGLVGTLNLFFVLTPEDIGHRLVADVLLLVLTLVR